jgi:hypothetical protein
MTSTASGISPSSSPKASISRSGRLIWVRRPTNAITGTSCRQPEHLPSLRHGSPKAQQPHLVRSRCTAQRRSPLLAVRLGPVTHGHKVGGHSCQHPLGETNQSSDPRREVAMQYMSVKGVHPDRHSGDHSGDPAHHTGFGGVGVHDVGRTSRISRTKAINV